MYDPVIKSTIEQLHQAGKSIREISRFLKLSRNTVRSIVRQKAKTPLREEHNLLELIRSLMGSCKGNLVRVHELLTNTHQQNIAYSTLTYWVRKAVNQKVKRHLGESPKTRYQQERPYCIDLPKVLPPIYNQLQRTVNSEGYICVETQRYSVPERLIGQIVDVCHYMNPLDIFYQHQKVATHQRRGW
jgi:hypothetical protein